MRGRTMLAVLLTGAAVLPVAACGDEGGVTVGPGTAQTSRSRFTLDGTGKELTQAQVDKAVLQQEDLPADGWYPESADLPDKDEDFAGMEPQGCREWFTSLPTDHKEWGATAIKRVQFSKQGGEKADKVTVNYTVITHPDPEKVNDNIDLMRQGPTRCATLTWPAEKVDVTGGIKAMEFQRPGDDSVANRLTMQAKGASGSVSESYQDALRVQVGHNLVIASVQSGKPVDEQQLKDILDKGFRRLEGAARS